MNKMTKALLVTFDFTQRGKSGTGLAAASFLAACQNHQQYGSAFTVSHLPIKMPDSNENNMTAEHVVNEIKNMIDLSRIDRLVLACYIWSTHLIEPVIALCKEGGFNGKIILGGYQIVESTCKQLYPSGDYYISSYAEVALPAAILDNTAISKKVMDNIMDKDEDFYSLPSPYLNGTLPLEDGQEMIHWETHRGCIFKCNFCLHRDIQTNSVFDLDSARIYQELELFKNKNIKKINVLDPVFNRGPNHLDILRAAIKINLKALLSLQVRFELIDEEFLELCSQLNVQLEFGLQTVIKEEYVTIERPNNLGKVKRVINMLNQWQQMFEVSLIYGLPKQTLASFRESISFLTDLGVTEIKAFPLMLLEGTELADKKHDFGLKEDVIDSSRIPHVIESNTFNRDEWQEMHLLAKDLSITQEVT
jgi:radical SAM superfamily enzyme YgiQ (UPF0313 family)